MPDAASAEPMRAHRRSISRRHLKPWDDSDPVGDLAQSYSLAERPVRSAMGLKNEATSVRVDRRLPDLRRGRRADAVDRGQILRGKPPLVGANVLLELGDRTGTGDDGDHVGLSEEPGRGKLRHRVAAGHSKGLKL